MIYDIKIKLSFTYIQNILSYIYIHAWTWTCGTSPGLAFPVLGL